MDRDAFVAVMNEASELLEQGEAVAALSRLTAFDDALLDQPDPQDYGWIVSYRFRAAFAAGDFAQALHIADQGPARFAADIPAGSMATMYSMAVEAATQLGQADSAVSMADKCITIRRQLGAPNEVLMAAMTACTLLGDIERHDLATPYAVLLVREGDGFDDYRAYGYYALCAAVEHQVGGDIFDILWSGRDWLATVDNEFAREAREYLDSSTTIRDRLTGALPTGDAPPPPEESPRSGRRRAKEQPREQDPTGPSGASGFPQDPLGTQDPLGDLSPFGPDAPRGQDSSRGEWSPRGAQSTRDGGPLIGAGPLPPRQDERSPFGPEIGGGPEPALSAPIPTGPEQRRGDEPFGADLPQRSASPFGGLPTPGEDPSLGASPFGPDPTGGMASPVGPEPGGGLEALESGQIPDVRRGAERPFGDDLPSRSGSPFGGLPTRGEDPSLGASPFGPDPTGGMASPFGSEQGGGPEHSPSGPVPAGPDGWRDGERSVGDDLPRRSGSPFGGLPTRGEDPLWGGGAESSPGGPVPGGTDSRRGAEATYATELPRRQAAAGGERAARKPLSARGQVPPVGELPPFGQLQPLNHEVAFGEEPDSGFGGSAGEVAFGDFSAELPPPVDRFPLGEGNSGFGATAEPDIPFSGLPQRSEGPAEQPRAGDPATMYLDLSSVAPGSSPMDFPVTPPAPGSAAEIPPLPARPAEPLASAYDAADSKQPPADQVAGGETADALLAAGRAGVAAAAFRALIDEAVETGSPDPLIMAKSVLGLLTALIFDDRAAEAHAVWTDENAATFLGIWGLENGQTSVHDAIAYSLVEAFLHALAGGDPVTAAQSVDTLMSRCVDYAFAQDPDTVAPILNTWRQHIHEIFEGTPPPPALAALHNAEQRWGRPIPPGPLYWMRPYPWVVDWL
ncbi:hypothetical protein [Nocardia sp. NPDC050406]|uniref:hypothetical protein n=1 Tax=Nocardia sp. NPDC050406 TaxID=3364318 RepID=UPI00379AE5B3